MAEVFAIYFASSFCEKSKDSTMPGPKLWRHKGMNVVLQRKRITSLNFLRSCKMALLLNCQTPSDCTISSNYSEQEEKLSCEEMTNQDNLAECPLLVFLDRKVDSL